VNRAHRLALAAGIAAAAGTACRQVDDRPAEWAYLSPALFQPSCATASCHSPAAAVSGLDFSSPENGYASLTSLWVYIPALPDGGGTAGLPCGIEEGTHVCLKQVRPLITPYDPAGSRLVNMLRARNAPRMPPDRPLPEDDIRLVERWILNGAKYPGFHIGDAGTSDAPADAHPGDGHPADARPGDARAADTRMDVARDVGRGG
jgi:hypothetical protein